MTTKFKISTLAAMTAVAAALLVGCSSSSEPVQTSETVEEVVPAEEVGPAEESEPSAPAAEAGASAEPSSSGYQAIYAEYSARLTAECPLLALTECAELSNEGVSEMAKYMYRAKGTDGQMATYEEWATKLMDVYMASAQ